MVAANVSGILTQGLHLRSDDRAFSWLPLYHDMGLVGFSIAPVFGQCSVDYLPPTTFARRPTLWLKLMSELGSTICYAPSFGYELAARRYRGEPAALDLSRLRVCGIGGDMIRPDALEEFADAVASTGFSRAAFLPSYGMAESTLAISIATPGRGYGLDTRDGRKFVICGRPLPDHDAVVVDADGRPALEGTVGQIRIRGASVMTRYAEDEGAGRRDPEEFLETGDLGYLVDGSIVVTGRSKDMILQNGRNIWPQDIEWAIERIAPSCRVAAFSVETAAGVDRIVVLVQTSAREQGRRDELLRQAQGATLEAAGVSCDIVLVAPNSLPFTSSGKLSRTNARQLYLSGTFSPDV
jgi:fatty-acyl-CoA synthase